MGEDTADRIEKAIARFAELQRANTRELVIHRWLILAILGAFISREFFA